MASLPDGNLAFKVTWIHGSNGPFSSPCSAVGRKINIVDEPRVWCSQQSCPCAQIYFGHKNVGDYWQYHNQNDFDDWPCYESMVFIRWQFGAGIFHNGSNVGNAIPIKHWRRGKFAFLTSREPGKSESERRIIGCFSMDRMTKHPDWGNVLHAGSIKLKSANFSNAPLFWNHHHQPSGPRWNTGLFRYLPDHEAKSMLQALKAVSLVQPTIRIYSNRKEAFMATTKGMSVKLKKQVKSANMKRANAFSQKAKIDKKSRTK
jgi:hypothetical protein